MNSFIIHRNGNQTFTVENEYSGQKTEIVRDVCQDCHTTRCIHTRALVTMFRHYDSQFPAVERV